MISERLARRDHPLSDLEDEGTPATTEPVAGGLSLKMPLWVGLGGAIAVVIGAVTGGEAFVSNLPGAWFFGTPGGPLGSVQGSQLHPPVLSLIAVFGGLLVMIRAWLSLLRVTRRHPGIPVRRITGVISAWLLPILLAPPLFSRDLYSYAGQGEMVAHSINPYLYGTGVLGSTPYSILPGPVWANTPSPYGPSFLWLDGFFTKISHHQVLATLVLLRLLAVVGLALALWALPILARSAGRDPGHAVALGLGSPLILGTLAGGGHNDALMIGLLLAGLAAAKRYGPVPGIVLCSLGAGVKATALLGVVFIGWNWVGADATAWVRARRTGLALGIAGLTLGVQSLVTGIGWGWLHTVTAEGKSVTGVTPVDSTARILTNVAHLLGVGIQVSTTRGIVGALGLLAAAVVTGVMLWRSPTLGLEWTLGVSLLALALLGPVLWAWYATWGLMVLAPVAGARTYRVIVALSAWEALVGATAVVLVFSTLVHAGIWADLLFLLGMAAAFFMPLGPDGYLLPPLQRLVAREEERGGLGVGAGWGRRLIRA